MKAPGVPGRALPAAALVFHCGRCGSTLLARFFEHDPANRVCLEPPELRRFTQKERDNFHRPQVTAAFRWLLLGLGGGPTDAEQRLIVKLHSLAVLVVPGVRRAFPETPLIYLLRDPVEVVASLLAWTPPFLGPDNRENLAAVLGGVDRPPADYAEAEWLAWYVGRNLAWAWENRDAFADVIDYRNHATRYPELVRRISGTCFSPDGLRTIQTLAVHSKYPDQPFSAVREASRIPAGLQDLVTPWAGAAYARWQEEMRARSRPAEPSFA